VLPRVSAPEALAPALASADAPIVGLAADSRGLPAAGRGAKALAPAIATARPAEVLRAASAAPAATFADGTGATRSLPTVAAPNGPQRPAASFVQWARPASSPVMLCLIVCIGLFGAAKVLVGAGAHAGSVPGVPASCFPHGSSSAMADLAAQHGFPHRTRRLGLCRL
jgi:hypothetical protein